MRVFEIETANREGWHELRARVLFENAPRREQAVCLRTPGEREATPTPGDVFVPALHAPCMALGESLHVDAPVSEGVLEAARGRIGPVLNRWHDACVEAPIHCAESVPDPEPGPGRSTGAFFSAGVDSWYTLLRNASRIDALLYVYGFEIDPDNEALWKLALAHAEDNASRYGKRLVPIVTDLRQVASRATMARLAAEGRPWPYFGVECYFGSMLVALGRFVSPGFDRILVAGSWPWECLLPQGSHPLIEPHWSTGDLAFELDGLDAGRVEKLRAIARLSPEALPRIRVCHDQQSDRLNCGRCMKCVRTRLEMEVAGCEDAIPLVFSRLPDVGELRKLDFDLDGFCWPDLIQEAERRGRPDVARTARIVVGEERHLPREVSKIRRMMERKVSKKLGKLARAIRSDRC